MLSIREAVLSILGDSFTVTHEGPGGSVVVSVNVGRGGGGAELVLPCVFVGSQFGDSSPENIGGNAASNKTFLDLSIEAIDSDSVYGDLLVDDIDAKVVSLIRAVEASVGSSFFTFSSSFRDLAPKQVSGLMVYRRIRTVSGMNLESY